MSFFRVSPKSPKYCDFSVFVSCGKYHWQLRPERVINDLETTMSTMRLSQYLCAGSIVFHVPEGYPDAPFLANFHPQILTRCQFC